MAAGSIACIDIGSSKICTVIADVADGRILEILGVGDVPSRGVRKGTIVEIDDAAMAVKQSVEQAESAAGFKAGRTYVGFTGKHIGSTNTIVSVDIARKDRMITESDIREAEKRLEAVSFPEDRVKVNVIKRRYAVDSVGGIRNPVGMHGYRLDLEAHIVTADYGYRENRAACLERAGVPFSSESFVANPRASAEAVLESEDKERGAIVADIGGGTTGIAVYREGSIWYTAALPVGGRQITNDLAIALSIPFSAAEELKLQAGTLYPEAEVQPAAAEILERCKISLEEVSYIIRARVEEILRMAQSKAPHVPDILVVTGGTANLPGMDRFAREVFGLQARVGVPRYLPEDSKGLDDPAYASAIGLLLWGSRGREYRRDGRGDFGGRLSGLYSGLRSGWGSVRSRLPRVSFGTSQPEETEG